MSKNVNFVGIKNLQKIIKELGVKPKVLECKGASNISQLLTGAKAITKKVSAPALVNKIYEIANTKGITFDYEVTVGLLLGEDNIITDDILNKLDSEVKLSNISEEAISDVDNNLNGLPSKEAIDFLNDVLNILYKDEIRHSKLVEKYAKKLVKLSLVKEDKIKAYKELIIAYYNSKKFEAIIHLAESIDEDLVNYTDKKIKISCYSNIAMAYYKQNQYEESIIYFKRLKHLGKNNNELFYLTLEGDVAVMKLDFKKAEKFYFNVLTKAQKSRNNDYIVNSYSNIADMYRKMSNEDLAKEYIKKSLDSINCGTSKMFKLNAYFNAFLIYENTENMEEYILKALPIAIEINNDEKASILMNKALNYYISVNDYTSLEGVLSIDHSINIDSNILLKFLKKI